MAGLLILLRNTCRRPGTANALPFKVLTTPSPAQHRVLDLVEYIRM
jgi:hypothetical protein